MIMLYMCNMLYMARLVKWKQLVRRWWQSRTTEAQVTAIASAVVVAWHLRSIGPTLCRNSLDLLEVRFCAYIKISLIITVLEYGMPVHTLIIHLKQHYGM